MEDLQSSEVHGYHLFLEPSGALGDELASVIARLAQEYGGPVFPPHVTLLSHIPGIDESLLVARAQHVASILPPIAITLGELASEDAYFCALYASVVEQDALTQCHALAAEAFSMKSGERYHAHLSLLYGNYPEEEKAQTRANVSLTQNPSFVANSVTLYKTEGEATTWRKVQEFPLVH